MKKPVFGTREWASSNLNLKQTGCPNGCKYCYACAMAVQYGRATPKTWLEPVYKGLPKFGKRVGTIMMPTTHDITEFNVDEFIEMMTQALELGNNLLIVSKPRVAVIARVIDALENIPGPDARDRVLFRFTIGSANNNILKLWEPGAPSFEDRMGALMLTHTTGFDTSVSSEPMLDSDIDKVIEATAPYITDAIWLGKANKLVSRVSMNTGKDPVWIERARALDAIWTDEAVMRLYAKYKDDPKVKWKESCKKIVGLDIPTEAGLDI
jgi:DNA repair photolyase